MNLKHEIKYKIKNDLSRYLLFKNSFLIHTQIFIY